MTGEYRNDRSPKNTQLYEQTTTFSADPVSSGQQFTTAPIDESQISVDITTFHDAAATINDTQDNTSDAISLLDEIPSIAAFLKRPALLSSNTLSVSTPLQPIFLTEETGRIPLASFNVPQSILNNGGKLDKIKNFRYFKGVCVFKFMTNANPFTQGRFWIAVAPMERQTRKCYKQLDKTLAALTSYPGIEIDVQTNTSATLRVPFLAEEDAIQTGLIESYAKVNVFSLTPISSPGLATSRLSFQVFGWIEDLELIGPTPLEVNTGTNRGFSLNESPAKKLASLQVATEAKGPVTEVSSVISNIADGISKSPLGAIPLVGTAASAVSWVSGAVNKVASIFGWSRPISGSFSTPFVQIPARGYGSTKAEDASTVLGFANDNSVGEYENNFQTDLDEMDVEYISSRPAVVATTNWLQNTSTNAVIMALPVGPQALLASTGTGTINRRQDAGDSWRYDLTNFEYLSTNFSHWRADIHYRFTFTKTAFHTGRVEIAFIPGHLTDLEISNSLQPTVDYTNAYRQIIDITNQNEINVTIPYVSMYPMSRCAIDNQVTAGNDLKSRPVGILIMRQLTPLIMPETVSPFVTVQAWKWASNVTFAGPLDSGLIDVTTVAPPVRRALANLEVGVDTIANPITQIVWGKENPNDLRASLAVAGERIHNIRALTRAHREMNTSIATNNMLNCNVGANLGGYIGRVSNLYTFYRGGLSFKFMPLTIDDVPVTGSCRSRLFTTRNGTTSKSVRPMEHTTFWTVNPVHEVVVPFYGNTRRMICNTNEAEDPTASSLRSVGVHVASTLTPLRALVGAKDDLTMSYLIGVPTQTITKTL